MYEGKWKINMPKDLYYFIFFFLQEDLYAKICSLSYMGDLRMLFAEDKNKVGPCLSFIQLFSSELATQS